MIKMRTLFNTLCHMLQRILESIKIVFCQTIEYRIFCALPLLKRRTFIYAILFNEKELLHMDLKSTLYQKLSEQDKQNIKELTNKYKTSDYTLAEIFNVKSEIYKNIPLSQLCLSARVVSAIIRFKNIIDLEKLLNLTLPQIWGIKNLGEIGINELVLLIQKYINDHTPKTKNSVQKPTNEEIQNLLNAIHSQGRSIREVTELLEKNII